MDRVEGLETTLAHLVPEMTANILIPLCLLVYLFVLDWRMALHFGGISVWHVLCRNNG